MNTYFDNIPDELIEIVFYYLRTEFQVLSILGNRLKLLYDNFINKINKGEIDPKFIFDYQTNINSDNFNKHFKYAIDNYKCMTPEKWKEIFEEEEQARKEKEKQLEIYRNIEEHMKLYI